MECWGLDIIMDAIGMVGMKLNQITKSLEDSNISYLPEDTVRTLFLIYHSRSGVLA